MAKVKPNKDLYSQFLLSTQGRYSMLWLAKLLDNQPAHDSWTRWLNTTKLKPAILWEEIHDQIDLTSGYLVIDDSVADKWYAEEIDLVHKQYSGTHHRLVEGIGIVSLLWTKTNQEHYALDFRLFAPQYDGKDKHDHARDMLESALLRDFQQPIVIMDSWYGATQTLKLLDSWNWTFVTAIPQNRQICVKPKEYRSVADLVLPHGTIGWMKKYGQVKVFKLVRPSDGDIEYVATNDLSLSAPDARTACVCRWRIEEYHRGMKQLTGLENCQFQNQRAQRNHILCSIRALLALERWRLERGVPWYEAKQQLIAEAIANYLQYPTIPLVKASA